MSFEALDVPGTFQGMDYGYMLRSSFSAGVTEGKCIKFRAKFNKNGYIRFADGRIGFGLVLTHDDGSERLYKAKCPHFEDEHSGHVAAIGEIQAAGSASASSTTGLILVVVGSACKFLFRHMVH